VFGYEHLLWVARLVLLGSVVLHIWAATSLTMQSRQSTLATGVSATTRYGKQKTLQATYASRTMRWGGIIIFLFIIFHILHLTFGVVGYVQGQFVHPHNGEYQVYNNVVYGFMNPFVSGFYILTMLFLGLHLYHGVWSMFQTLGLNSARTNSLFRGIAILVTLVVVVGNISFPLAVMAGFVPLA
jgi:succinate dehydrogenase / fumarate reductase cytochrome b subunit